MTQQRMWKAKPSHLLNLSYYIFCLCMIVLAILWQPEIMAISKRATFLGAYYSWPYKAFMLWIIVSVLIKILQIETHSYEITHEVFREKYGIVNRVIQELELYRVIDSSMVAPMNLHMFGYGNIILNTNDASTPVAVLAGIKNPEHVRELLRTNVERCRRKRGIMVLE